MRSRARWMQGCTSWAAFLLAGAAVRGQVVITEVMQLPGGSDALWEWVEVLNTTSSPVDLDGWVFDDDDEGSIGTVANIDDDNGNTLIPANGVAVLYSGDTLQFMPERFTNAWGAGITMIAVDGLTALGEMDAIGLWPSVGDYINDAIPGSTASPRRTFTRAVASFDSSSVATPDTGHSITWNGTGSPTDPARWVGSNNGSLGAHTSEETMFDSVRINNTMDRGNPGLLPGGAASTGLLISEIMFAPLSPQVSVGFQEDDFEWVEIYNNTAQTKNLAGYVVDDIAGSKLSAANIAGGSLAPGENGILFNNDNITLEQMQTMWGSDNTYIPVSNWSALNNSTGGDTLAIWETCNAYNTEAVTGSGRTHANAVAAVAYNIGSMAGWPGLSNGNSIYMTNLSGDPNAGANWKRAGTSGDTLSFNPQGIFQPAIDHIGGDVGSPGHVPGVVAPQLSGDYSNDGAVNAADYAVWRNANNSSTTLPNDVTPGTVNASDYDVWRANFGRSLIASGSTTAVPEPASAVLMVGGSVLVAAMRLRRCALRRVER